MNAPARTAELHRNREIIDQIAADTSTILVSVGEKIEHQGQTFVVRKKTFKGDLVLRRIA